MAWDSAGGTMAFRMTVQGARQVEAANRRVAKSVKDIGDEASRASKKTGHLDQSLKTMGAFRWASYAGFATVATGIGSVTQEALGFEDAMAKVRAISMDDPSLNFEQHWKQALVVARDFRATGAETANALYQIAAAGVPASEQMDVLTGSLSLAAATGYDQAQAAQTQLGILNSFGLGMDQATTVADMLTQAVNISAIGMEDLAYTMKYVAAPAHAANQSLEGVLGIVSLLGKRGMRGENVGTGLATGMQRLVDPSKEALESLKDIGLTMDSFKGSDGNLKPITEIMDMMVVALKRAPDDFTRLRIVSDVFGKDAADVWMSLVNAFDEDRVGVQLLLNQFGEFDGKAKQTAAIMDDTVTASLDRLWGAITEVTTTKFMGERGGIQDWVDDLTTKVENFDLNKWIDENRESIDAFMESAEAFGTLMMDGVIPAFSELHKALAPELGVVLILMTETLKFMAENADTLKPLIIAMTAMYVAQSLAAGRGIPGLPWPGKNRPPGAPVPGPGGGKLGDLAKKGGRLGNAAAKAVTARTVAAAVLRGAGPWALGIGATVTAAQLASNYLDTDPFGIPTSTTANDRGQDWGMRGVRVGDPNMRRWRAPAFLANYQGEVITRSDYQKPAGELRPIIVKLELNGREIARAATQEMQDAHARRF